MKDKNTMSYNKGYDIDLKGYNKQFCTIIKSDDEIKNWYKKWINKEPDKYYAYIYTDEIDEPIGEVYYYLENNIHAMGIVIQDKYRKKGHGKKALLELQKIAFEKNNINELSDYIPLDRVNAIKTFKKEGFIETNNYKIDLVFGQAVKSKQLIITKEMYNRR